MTERLPQKPTISMGKVPIGRPRYWREGIKRRLRVGIHVENVSVIDRTLEITGWAFGISHVSAHDKDGVELKELSLRLTWSPRPDVLEQHVDFVATSELGFVLQVDLIPGGAYLALHTSPLEANPIMVWSTEELVKEAAVAKHQQYSDLALNFLRVRDGSVELQVESQKSMHGQELTFDCWIENREAISIYLGKITSTIEQTTDGKVIGLQITKAILFAVSSLGSRSWKLRLASAERDLVFELPMEWISDQSNSTLIDSFFSGARAQGGLLENCIIDLSVTDVANLHLVDAETAPTDLGEVEICQLDETGIHVLNRLRLEDGRLPLSIKAVGLDVYRPVLVVIRSISGTVVGLDVVLAPWLFDRPMRDLLSANYPTNWRTQRRLEIGLTKRALSGSELFATTNNIRGPIPRFFHVSLYGDRSNTPQIGIGDTENNSVTNIRRLLNLGELFTSLYDSSLASDDDIAIFHDAGAIAPDIELHVLDQLDEAKEAGLKWSGVSRDSRGLLFHIPPATSGDALYSATCRSFCVSIGALRSQLKLLGISQSMEIQEFFQSLWTLYEGASKVGFVAVLQNFEEPMSLLTDLETKHKALMRNTNEIENTQSSGPWSVVISFRDQIAITKSSIVSVIENNYGLDLEFILVNNMSNPANADELYDWIEKRYPQVRLVCLEYAQRFNHSAQTNLGIATASNPSVAVLSNDAVFLTPNALSRAQEVLELETVATVGFLVEESKKVAVQSQNGRFTASKSQLERSSYLGLSFDTTPHAAGVSQFFPLLKKFREYPSFALSGAVEVGGNSFGSVCVNKLRFQNLGGLDSIRFPNDYNDVEFSLRSIAKGYTHFALADVRILHPKNGSRQSEYPFTGSISVAAHAVAAQHLASRTMYLL